MSDGMVCGIWVRSKQGVRKGRGSQKEISCLLIREDGIKIKGQTKYCPTLARPLARHGSRDGGELAEGFWQPEVRARKVVFPTSADTRKKLRWHQQFTPEANISGKTSLAQARRHFLIF